MSAHPDNNIIPDARAIDIDLSFIFTFLSLCPCFLNRKESGRNLSRVSREALEKPCTIHERQCAQPGAFASSLARASNFPGFSWPTSARTLRFLPRIIPNSAGHCQDGNGVAPVFCVAFAKSRTFPVLYFVTCGYGSKSDTEAEKAVRGVVRLSSRFGSSSRAPGPTR